MYISWYHLSEEDEDPGGILSPKVWTGLCPECHTGISCPGQSETLRPQGNCQQDYMEDISNICLIMLKKCFIDSVYTILDFPTYWEAKLELKSSLFVLLVLYNN